LANVVLADELFASKGPKVPDGPVNKAIGKDVVTVLGLAKEEDLLVHLAFGVRRTEPVLKELANKKYIACLVRRAKDVRVSFTLRFDWLSFGPDDETIAAVPYTSSQRSDL
jgi:hypothetical protein